jgi:extradiol dioxygenase family protein
MKTTIKNVMTKHWLDMLVSEQLEAWGDEDIWGKNYQMDAAHAEESVRYYIKEVEDNEELRDVYGLIIDCVDWQALKEEVLKEATLQWHVKQELEQ